MQATECSQGSLGRCRGANVIVGPEPTFERGGQPAAQHGIGIRNEEDGLCLFFGDDVSCTGIVWVGLVWISLRSTVSPLRRVTMSKVLLFMKICSSRMTGEIVTFSGTWSSSRVGPELKPEGDLTGIHQGADPDEFEVDQARVSRPVCCALNVWAMTFRS